MKLRLLGLVVALILAGFVVMNYYSYLFSKDVAGEVISIQRVTDVTTVIGNGRAIPEAQLYSFAVAIKVKSGEIMTASSEDRQWAVVEKGKCAEAKFYPYPPWKLDRAGTFHGARLLKLYECGGAPQG